MNTQIAGKYRADIDGIRALAVLSVLAYHYGVPLISGGFAGVDMFFVISGYIITRRLVDDVSQQQFSLIDFYARRIRRIYPALVMLIVTCLLAGFLLLIPGDYAELGKSAAYATFGFGNFYFYDHTGYFDQQSGLLPLLHTWSLGVEEQFYLVWPTIAFAILWMRKRWNIPVVLPLVAVILPSFAFGLHQLRHDPIAAFYLPLERVWELAVGALVVFAPPLVRRDLAWGKALVGLGAMTWTLLYLDTSTPFPGWAAIPAVAGVALLVWPAAPNPVSLVLSLPPLRLVGLISYSLYLWHWPVLAFYRVYNRSELPTPSAAAALACISLALSAASWRYVETPFRRPRSKCLTILIGTTVAAVLAGSGLILSLSDGFPDRLPPEARKMASLEVMWKFPCMEYVDSVGDPSQNCIVGSPWSQARRRGIIWGDSHAQHLAPLFDAVTRGTDISFLVIGGCPGSLGGSVERRRLENPNYERKCKEIRRKTIRMINQDHAITTVVFSSSWKTLATTDLYAENSTVRERRADLLVYGLRETIREFARPGLATYVLTDIPGPGFDPVPCALHALAGYLRKDCSAESPSIPRARLMTAYRPVIDAFSALSGVATVVHPGDGLCDARTCLSTLNGEYLFRDGGHLRRNLSAKTDLELARRIGIERIVSAMRSSSRIN